MAPEGPGCGVPASRFEDNTDGKGCGIIGGMSEGTESVYKLVSIQICFRHFDGTEKCSLTEPGAANILIGRNNSGKTSILRALSFIGKNADSRIAFEFRIPLKVERRISGATTIHVIDSWPFFVGWNHGRWAVEGACSVPGGVGNATADDNGVRFTWGSSHPDLRLNLKPESRKAVNQAYELVTKKVKEGFFLWHRRKSDLVEKYGEVRRSLDTEATHIPSRIASIMLDRDTVLQQKIDAFMNSVIPGIGELSIKTVEGEEEQIAVRFKDDKGNERLLDDLGGGVEQVLAIAIVLLAERDDVPIFLEEPEAHLHEGAQRSLLSLIRKHQGKRLLFISTHSPIFVDAFSDASVYQVSKDGGRGRISKCVTGESRRALLDELDVRPSTLLQTNFVIWVEGPSDAVLIEHWLRLVDERLRNHVHYHFAHTGGSVFENFNWEGEDTQRVLGGLLRTCRNTFLVADRDGKEGLKKFVERARKELTEDLCWITDGYEIEWYFPDKACVKKWGEEKAERLREDAGRSAFYTTMGISNPKKKLLAEEMISTRMGLTAEDWFSGERGSRLEENVQKLALKIQRSNGLETLPKT